MSGYRFAVNLQAIFGETLMYCAGLSSYADTRNVLLSYDDFNSIKPKTKNAEIAQRMYS